MICILLSLLCIVFIFMTNRGMSKYTEPISTKKSTHKLTVAYDFDDCLKNVKTKNPLSDVVNNMLKDYENQYRVIIVTARGALGVPEIENFLKQYNLNGKVPIYTTGDTVDRKKSPIICRENVDVFFDDQPGFLEDVAKNCPKVQLFQTFPDSEISIRPYPSNRKRMRDE